MRAQRIIHALRLCGPSPFAPFAFSADRTPTISLCTLRFGSNAKNAKTFAKFAKTLLRTSSSLRPLRAFPLRLSRFLLFEFTQFLFLHYLGTFRRRSATIYEYWQLPIKKLVTHNGNLV